MADWHPNQKAEWDEYRVVQIFCRWLEARGWSTEIEVDHVDVVATRADQVVFAEVKGNTKSRPGAVVVSTSSVAAALCVPRRVRELLRITVYEVTDDGRVSIVDEAGAAPQAEAD